MIKISQWARENLDSYVKTSLTVYTNSAISSAHEFEDNGGLLLSNKNSIWAILKVIHQNYLTKSTKKGVLIPVIFAAAASVSFFLERLTFRVTLHAS